MIVGLGTDVVQVERIARAIERYGDHFLEKLFIFHNSSHSIK